MTATASHVPLFESSASVDITNRCLWNIACVSIARLDRFMLSTFVQTREIRDRLTKWHRERGTRQPHEELSLTQFVWPRLYTEGSNHLAPPYFAHHHNLSNVNPTSHTYDQPTHLPPLMYNSPTPSGSYVSEGSPPPDGLFELGDGSHALDAGGDSPAVNDTAFSPGLVDTNDPLYGADDLTFQGWTPTIFPCPEPVAIETGAFGGLETRDYGIGDLRNTSEPAAVRFPYIPMLPMILEPEAVAYSSRGCRAICGFSRSHLTSHPASLRFSRGSTGRQCGC